MSSPNLSSPQEKREEIARLVEVLIAAAMCYSRDDVVQMHGVKGPIMQAIYRVAGVPEGEADSSG